MLHIGVLSSTKATDLQVIIDSINSKKLDAEISVVISNNKNAYALERASKYKIKSIFLEPKNKEKEDYDREISKELDQHNVDLILLIGYMKILSSWFVRKYKNRIMNIHPSLLPAFAAGMDKNVHQNVLSYGCKVTGCTLHFVDESVDGGPIIMQKAVEIDNDENVDSLKAKVQKAEQEIILKAIALFGSGKLSIKGRVVKIMNST